MDVQGGCKDVFPPLKFETNNLFLTPSKFWKKIDYYPQTIENLNFTPLKKKLGRPFCFFFYYSFLFLFPLYNLYVFAISSFIHTFHHYSELLTLKIFKS